jgi:hypothetical protein
MRRLGIGVVIGLLAPIVVGAAPAWAHLCNYADQIKVGPSQTISIGVTVENATVPDVEIDVPPQLVVNRVDPAVGFTKSRSGQTVRFQGGPIEPYTCQYFTLGVQATEKGAFVIPVTQRDAGGTVVASTHAAAGVTPNPRLVQVVYAGVPVPKSASGSGSSTSPVLIIGIAIVALALLALAFFGIRSWRDRNLDYDDEEEDLDARVEEFKRQARDRAKR